MPRQLRAFDLHERQWSGEILEALEVDIELFPPLADSPDVVGAITQAAAEQTGLVAGHARRRWRRGHALHDPRCRGH